MNVFAAFHNLFVKTEARVHHECVRRYALGCAPWGFHCLQHSLKLRALSLHHNRHVHCSADELRQRDFQCLRNRLCPMDLSLYHDRHGGSIVDVLLLRNIGVLGHLGDRRDVHQIADELRLRGFSRLRHRQRLKDLSLYRKRPAAAARARRWLPHRSHHHGLLRWQSLATEPHSAACIVSRSGAPSQTSRRPSQHNLSVMAKSRVGVLRPSLGVGHHGCGRILSATEPISGFGRVRL